METDAEEKRRIGKGEKKRRREGERKGVLRLDGGGGVGKGGGGQGEVGGG